MRSFVLVALLLCASCTLKSEGVNPGADASTDQPDADTPDPDAAIDGAVALTECGMLDTVICDGFEGDLGAWSQQGSGGTPEIVTDVVFRGNGALKVTTPTAGANGYLRQTISPITAGSIYTRGYYYFPSTLITAGLVELTNTGDGSGIHFHFSADTNTPVFIINNQTADGSADFPRDTWFCMEMRIDIGANGGGELFIDGQSVAAISGLDTDLAGGYEALELGIYDTSPAQGAYEVYVDEVAMAVTPIGCDPI